MTIKQLGGVFGRNPTFNDVTIEGTLTFDGDIDITSDLTIEDNLYVLGSVGIGTTTPGVKLGVLNGSDSDLVMLVRGADDTTEYMALGVNGSNGVLTAGASGSESTNMVFRTASSGTEAEAMRIDSSGNVGIGTSTNLLNGTLNVESNGTAVLQARADTAGVNAGDTTVVVSRALNSTAGKWANAIYRGYSHAWSYGTGASTSEAMRIDSSGNLLVGTTSESTWESAAGFRARSSGSTTITRDGNPPLYVNRLTSDGAIAQFQQGTTVLGSIGSYAGSYLQIGTGDSGLAFDVANSIRPVDMAGAQRDGGIDLGHSSARFKNLWLSGGVYVGGTSAANKLDDYEEGTWTPTVAGDATGAFSTAEGTYTKIGRLVFIEMYVVVSTNFTSNYIGGLPFPVGDLLTGTSLGQSAVVLTNAADTVTGSALEGSGNMRFFNDHNTASFHNPDTTNGGYRLSLCYQAT